jgi:hypothetical protein
MPVISVWSEGPVGPGRGPSEFRCFDEARALDFQICVRPDPRPAGRPPGAVLSRDKILTCLSRRLRMLVLDCTLVS